MRAFSGVRVRTKLILSFLAVALIGALIGGLGIRSLGQVNTMSSDMYEYETRGIRFVSEAHTRFVMIGREFRNVFLASTEEARQSSINTIESLFRQLQTDLDLSQSVYRTEEGQREIAEARAYVNEYKKLVDSLLAGIGSQPYFVSSPLVREIANSVTPVGDSAEALLLKTVEDKEDFAERYSQNITEEYHTVRWGLILFTLFGVIVGLTLGVLITRFLLRQLGGEPAEVSAIADAISQGKLDIDLNLDALSKGSVMHSMGVMENSLRRLVTEVRSSSDNIATGTNQIAAGNMDLSQRTEEQAANVTETASAMEEITSTLRSNADAAREATQLAGVVRHSAAEGREVVQEVVVSIQEMQSSSEQIASIINVIDSIAFQTNILALNAAVEAARAGSEGRGFAVVASEVRTLAQRSAAAAQDIKKLIEESVSKVSEGNRKVTLAGATIDSMVEQVNQVATLIDEISSATLEQNAGVEQVNLAIGQLEEVTQQNSALVEQSAAAAAALNDQAARLVEVVRVFDLGDTIEAEAGAQYARPSRMHQLSDKSHLLNS